MSNQPALQWREFSVKVATESEDEFKAVRKGLRTMAETLPPHAIISLANTLEHQPEIVDNIFHVIQNNPMIRRALGIKSD